MSMFKKEYIIVHSNNIEYSIETDNPYIVSEIDTTHSTPLLNSHIEMPPDILKKALDFDKLKCPIRCVISLDIIISVYYFYFTWLLGLAFTTASVTGFIATINHKKSMMTCYVGYQYFQVIGRATNLGYFIYIVSSNNSNTVGNNSSLANYNESSVNSNNTMEIMMLTIMFLAQIYIAKVVTRFYNLMPCDVDRDRISYRSAI